MTVNIIRINEQYVVARTVCDDCQAIMDERPARPGEHVGVTLMVCDWCKECSPKHCFPLDVPWHTVRGMSIGNPWCVAKVKITEEKK